MDDSWLFENEVKEEEEETESDEEDKQTELEERLYAVVHHNDLSQPLPSELAKHYTIQCADNGELEVILNNSLEAVKSADSEQICSFLKTSDSHSGKVDQTSTAISANEDDDDLIIVDVINKTNATKPTNDSWIQNTNVRKRFRYSDVTLDEFQGKEVNVESTTGDIYYFDHNFGLFQNRKNRKYKNLKVPPPPNLSDWKNDSTASFISVGDHVQQEKEDIINGMTKALKELNPGENVHKLAGFARILYKRNTQVIKRKLKREKRKRAKKLDQLVTSDSSLNSSFNISKEIIDMRDKIKEYYSKTKACSETSNCERKREEHFSGSISLNISPFKPNTSMSHVVDLTLDIKNSTACNSNTRKENSSPTLEVENSHFPAKWTKAMIKFYSKRCKKKLAKDISEVIANLTLKSKGKNWYLDPKDRSGQYQRSSPGMFRNLRCDNCNERGHIMKACYKPIKLPACTLCGELYHTDFSCPNKVCFKCGTFLVRDVFQGECNDCYYSTFRDEEPCSICQEVTHKSSNCTDLWRSFHATTGGEKKIPDNVMVNIRKYCCNCGRKGHFSHTCPFITYSGQQISSFVKNYSAEPSERGSVNVVISKNYADIIFSDEADQFFHYLSNHTQAVIGVDGDGYEIVCKIDGTFEQCKRAKLEIQNYVNTRKRKRHEPKSKRKRQRVRW